MFFKTRENPLILDYYTTVKSSIVKRLKNIQSPTEEKKTEIEEINNTLLTFFKPAVFNGRESVEIQHEKKFSSLCFFVSKHTNADPKKMTVLEFFNTIETIEKSLENARKSNNV